MELLECKELINKVESFVREEFKIENILFLEEGVVFIKEVVILVESVVVFLNVKSE